MAGETPEQEKVTRALLERYGRTYADQAGIKLRDSPTPLYQLAVLTNLLSARIRADTAVAAARELFAAGMRTARGMVNTPWQERVDALGRGGYRRYDERTATQLGDGAQLLLDRYRGDLRRLREEEDPPARLAELPGIGRRGVDIFFREVQAVWPQWAPYLDDKALEGARKVGLPTSREALARLVPRDNLPRLAAGLVRVTLVPSAAEEVRAHAA